MLAGEVRILGQDAHAVVAVAGDARLAGLRRRADRATRRLEFSARQVRSDVGQVRVGERRRLRVHRRVRAIAGLVLLQRGNHVRGVLATQLRHVVDRIRVPVVRDAVAAVARVGQLAAADGVSRRREARGEQRKGQAQCEPGRSRGHGTLLRNHRSDCSGRGSPGVG